MKRIEIMAKVRNTVGMNTTAGPRAGESGAEYVDVRFEFLMHGIESRMRDFRDRARAISATAN